MKTLVTTLVLLALVVPTGPVQAANKPGSSSSSSSFAQQQQKRTGVFAFLKRKLIPWWKKRFLTRQQTQWDKPGGVNFPDTKASWARWCVLTRSTRCTGMTLPRTVRRRARVGFWTRLRNAWRSRWKTRQITASQRSTLENQAGFGANISRPFSSVAYSWRNRFDNKRLRPKKPMRRRRFKPRPPPRRYRPPPPGW